MPDDNKNNQNGGAPDPAENKENGNGGNNDGGAGGGQSQDGQGAGGDDETITIKKSEYNKTLSDLENYKKGVISDKNRPLPDGKPNGGGDGGAAPDNKANGAGNGLTEEKVKEIAVQVSSQNTHKANEKTAKEKFYIAHPDYVESNAWQELITHYSPKSGKDTVEDILNDLEDAVLAHKRRTGKLDEYFAQQRKEAERKAQIDAQVNMGQSAGGVGDRSNSGGGQKSITDSTVEMGKNFGQTKESLEEGLKTITKGSEGYELDITPKPKVKK